MKAWVGNKRQEGDWSFLMRERRKEKRKSQVYHPNDHLKLHGSGHAPSSSIKGAMALGKLRLCPWVWWEGRGREREWESKSDRETETEMLRETGRRREIFLQRALLPSWLTKTPIFKSGTIKKCTHTNAHTYIKYNTHIHSNAHKTKT